MAKQHYVCWGWVLGSYFSQMQPGLSSKINLTKPGRDWGLEAEEPTDDSDPRGTTDCKEHFPFDLMHLSQA